MTDASPLNPARKPRGLYIVWSPEGAAPPKVSHTTHGQAHFAAQQMAKLHPGQTFYVMEKAGASIRRPKEACDG